MDYVGIRVILPDPVQVGTLAGAITSFSDNLQANTKYIFQFKIINYSSENILNNIVAIDKEGTSTVLSNNLNIPSFLVVNTFTDEGMTKNEYLCHLSFTPPREGGYCFGITRTVTDNDIPGKMFDIREVSCEKGSILQDFKDNSNDLQDFIRICQTYFEQTDQKLSLLAKREDVYQTKDDTGKEIYQTKEEVYSEITANTDSINLSVNEKINTATTNLEGEIEITKQELTSKIEMTSESITLEVEKKVDNDSVISSINMSPEEIQIQAEKIDMTGALRLNGEFTCYTNTDEQNGNYLYQSGAIHRGYLEGKENPTFSSGIWRPDGINDMGYVSVGWTNSDHVDQNGCLWMSPDAGGGGHLYFSKLENGQGVFSGIRYGTDGTANYYSFMPNRTLNNYYSHTFDGGISCHSLESTALTCTSSNCSGNSTVNGVFQGVGEAYFGNNIKFNNTLYTDSSQLNIRVGGWAGTYGLHFINSGYFNPIGHVQLGTSFNPFYQLVCTYAPSVVSDQRKKENINYIASSTSPMTMSLDNEPTQQFADITIDDMYLYIKEIPLATYNLKDSKEDAKKQIGFIAQDIQGTKVGDYIIDDRDPNNLSYDLANRVSVLEGALKKAIETIEYLLERVDNNG